MTNIDVLRSTQRDVLEDSETMVESEDAIVVSVLEQLAQRRRRENFGTIAKITEQMRRGADVVLEPVNNYQPAPYREGGNYKGVGH